MKYSEKDYKRILNIQGQYTLDSLKKAYYEAAKRNHPDKFKNPINKKLATEKMKIINEAYDYLKDNVNNQTKTDYTKYTQNNKPNSTNTTNTNANQHQNYRQQFNNQFKQSRNIYTKLVVAIRYKRIIEIEYKLHIGGTIKVYVLPISVEESFSGQILNAVRYPEIDVREYKIDRILDIQMVDDCDATLNKFYDSYNPYKKKSSKQTKTKTNDIPIITLLLPIITSIVIVFNLFDFSHVSSMFLRTLVCLTLLNTTITLRKFLPIFVIYTCIAGIIIYNPIFPMHLPKFLWLALDIIVLIGLNHLLKGYFTNE